MPQAQERKLSGWALAVGTGLLGVEKT